MDLTRFIEIRKREILKQQENARLIKENETFIITDINMFTGVTVIPVTDSKE